MPWREWRGPEVIKKVEAAERAALRTVAREILAAAKQEVPLDDGDLLASGKILRSRAKVPIVRIRFGGPQVAYAVRWHEAPAEFKGGRKRRYLADPFNRIAPQRVPQEMRREFRMKLGRLAR